LLTSQVVPKKNENFRVVDDVTKAIRIEGTPTIAADQNEASVKILIPGDLPVFAYDLAFNAELLSADGKQVLATAVAPSRRFVPRKASFSLELVGPPMVEAKAGGGETGKLTGRLKRVAGYDQPVTITLAGLPKDLPAPAVQVPADKTEFELAVAFPFGTAPADLSGVKLVATSQVAPATVVKADNEIAVTLKIVPGEPPPGLLAIFEDQPEFAAKLTEGGGAAELVADQKYSGIASIKVMPDQRYNPLLPGLGLKIRENPAPGEYRYLRFAWKKQGGQSICLQLNHDGKWGPSDDKPAKFRYHAGPGPECFGASLQVDPLLPGEFVVVTRDLFADFGEFTWTGIALSPIDGDYALFDHLYLGRSLADLDTATRPETKNK
jgi:hypothetical protein